MVHEVWVVASGVMVVPTLMIWVDLDVTVSFGSVMVCGMVVVLLVNVVTVAGSGVMVVPISITSVVLTVVVCTGPVVVVDSVCLRVVMLVVKMVVVLGTEDVVDVEVLEAEEMVAVWVTAEATNGVA